MANALQAVLDRAKTQTEQKKEEPAAPRQVSVRKKKDSKKTEAQTSDPKKGRTNTVLIGGHFPPEVAKQLRILAAEEETTNQALLEHALDLLFVKKGKRRIADL